MVQAAGCGQDATIEYMSFSDYNAQEAIEILQPDTKHVQGLLEKLHEPAD